MGRTLEALQALAGDTNIAPAVSRISQMHRIHIIVEPSRRDRLVQAAAAANLLSRVFNSVSFEGADLEKHLELPKSIQNRIKVGDTHRSTAQTFVVFSKNAYHFESKKVIYADNRGWTTYLSTTMPCPHPEGEENPLSALYAAGLAVNEAFNDAFAANIRGVALLDGSSLYDMLTGRITDKPRYEPGIEKLLEADVDVSLVGAGAVGQAMVYALGMLPTLRGRFHAVDQELIDQDNFERYILASPETINKVKAEFVARYLARRFPLLDVGFNVPAFDGGNWLQQYVNVGVVGESAVYSGWPVNVAMVGIAFPRMHYQQWRMYDGETPRRLVVCAVDSAKARRDIQFGLHKVILNGWTETDVGLQTFGVGRHTIGDEACMACQYHQKESAAPDPIEFDRRLTDLPPDRIRELRQDRTKVPTREELEHIARHRKIPLASLAHAEGKPLAIALQQLCGVATVQDQDRLGTSPVAHVGFLVGVQLAAFVLLDSHGWPEDQPKLIQGDARTLPRGAFWVPPRQPRDGCLCKEELVRSHYQKLWA